MKINNQTIRILVSLLLIPTLLIIQWGVFAQTPPLVNQLLERLKMQQEKQQLLIQADELYLSGNKKEAEKLYRQVKDLIPRLTADTTDIKPPITDPEQLSVAGQVYWKKAQQALSSNTESLLLPSLEFLVQSDPQFIPGIADYTTYLARNRQAPKALEILEPAIANYPDQPSLITAKVEALSSTGQHLEAAIAARQFAIINPDHPNHQQFLDLADQKLKEHQRKLRDRITRNTVLNFITGAVGYGLMGNIWGPITAVETGWLLIRGESAVGNRIANQIKKQVKLVKDPDIIKYIQELGAKLVKATGRQDLPYEFNIIQDPDLNAFALPGGKIFVNTGAILKTQSEAELAGLLAHELAHAVLSHGFQLVTSASLTRNITQYIPYAGGTVGNLLSLRYSRDFERQADLLGTRILASTDYAADGLQNLMITLNKENPAPSSLTWLSSHPVTTERINYIDQLINRYKYNRYSFLGINQHLLIQQKLLTQLPEPDKKNQNL